MLGRRAAATALMLALCGCGEAPPPPVAASTASATVAPAPEAAPATDPAVATAKRISDLVAIKTAIDAFHAKNGAYPTAYDGLLGVLDRGKDWIPGLAPEFIPELPRDPALSDSRDGPQYHYVSDRKGFKLIAHGVSGMCDSAVEQQGIRMDPARTKDGACWAFGFWTPDFETF